MRETSFSSHVVSFLPFFLSFTSAFDASTLGFGVLLAIACSVPAVASSFSFYFLRQNLVRKVSLLFFLHYSSILLGPYSIPFFLSISFPT
jgi:hypothetical protein